MNTPRRLLRPPRVVADYFGGDAFVAQEFRPGRGWQRPGWRKRISVSYARTLRREGVTHVALQPVTGGPRRADFGVAEIIAGGVSPQPA